MVDSLPLPLISSLFDAMSFYCPRVTRITAREYKPSTETSLAEALIPWLEKRHNGALNCALFSLNVAFVALSNRYPRSTAYANSLCDWCPTIHSLTGWMQESFDSECNEQWIIDSKTWERFCSTCCSIRKFSWIVVPFKTDFFEVFGKYKELHLHEPTFATASNLLWELYFHETNAKLVYDFGWHAKNVCVVLKACPALQRLRVHLSKPQRRARGTLVADTNQEVFGDEFCEELVRYCLDLDSFTITEVQLSASDDSPIMSFTDKALLSLSRLRHLKHLDLKAVNVTGVGVFRLIDNVSEHIRVQRHFTIAVGSLHGVKEVDFYAVLRRFFVCLVEHQSALKFITQRIS